MRVGSLVKYKKRKIPKLGVITGKRFPTIKQQQRWIVQWANGKKYSENEIHLEVVCE